MLRPLLERRSESLPSPPGGSRPWARPRLAHLPFLLLPATASGAPDIVLESISSTVTAAFAGSPSAFQVTVRNDGDAAGAFSTTLRLSTDAVYDDTDPLICIDGTATSAGLTAGQRRVFAVSCSFPDSSQIGSGNYWLVARTGDGVGDTNLSNNTASHINTISITSTGTGPTQADLRPTELTPPATLTAGSTVSIIYSATNQGNATSVASTSTIWLSTDPQQDGGDPTMCSDTLPPIAPGGTLTRTVSGCGVPAAATGSLYTVLRLDSGSTLPESSESNNDLATPVAIAVQPDPLPDLRLGTIGGPSSITIGDTLSWTVAVSNDGDVAAPATPVEARLSTDALFDSGDLLICRSTLTSLAASLQQTVDLARCTVPSQAQAGPAYLVVRVDPDGAVDEADEGNNDGARSVTLSVGDPVTPIDTDDSDITLDSDSDAATDSDAGSDTDTKVDGRPRPVSQGTFGCSCGQGGMSTTPVWLALTMLLRRRRLRDCA